MTNEISKPSYQSQLAKVNDLFMPMIVDQLQGNHIEMTDYQRTVVLNAMTAISTALDDAGLTIKDVDQNGITNQLLTVAALQLNASANPRELYFITRRKKDKKTGQYKQTIEMGIEGDGNDALLARFGRNVKKVYPYWAVREGDGFTYPMHRGIVAEPPSWTESGSGKVIRVVYPIEYTDGHVEYHIGERADVKKNLIAHVSQNLMWDKSDAKEKFLAKAKDMTLDEILDDPEMVALGNISPAWSSQQARESMIVRKMRNNVVKKIPKDFGGNSFVQEQYTTATDESYKATRRDITENANKIDFDSMPATKVIDEPSEPKPQPSKPITDDGEIIEPTVQPKQGPQEPEQPTLVEATETEDDPF